MVGATRKRKAPNVLAEATKRQRVEKDPETGYQLKSEDDDDEFEYRSNTGDFSDNEKTADTPMTPFSPSRKKFPSELNHLKCTWDGCTKTFNRPIRLERHLKTHTNERTFICSYEDCDKAYFEDKHLQQHIKGSHTHERKHQCDWEGCGKSFMTATRLRRHVDAHQGHERFRCTSYPPCNETFRKHQTLQRHIRSDHLELAPYPCTYVDPTTNTACNAGFDGAAGLRKHQDRVHGALQFFCLQCIVPYAVHPDGSSVNLGFTTNALLQTHIRKEHANTICMFCELKCSNQLQLQKHIDGQHSGTTLEQRKTVRCTFIGCDKSFTKKSNMTIHMRTAHMGERYVCGEVDVSSTPGLDDFTPEDGCEEGFVSKATLEGHIRTAHLHIPSLINSRRKQSSRSTSIMNFEIENEDEQDIINDEEYDPKPKPKRHPGRQKASAISQLVGDISVSNQDPSTRRSSRRQVAQAQPIYTTDPLSNFDWPEMNFFQPPQASCVADAQHAYQPEQPEQHSAFAPPAPEIDWSLQRQALETGPFWVNGGGENGNAADTYENPEQSLDPWARDAMEMAGLIAQNNSTGEMYPGMQNDGR